MSEDTLRADGKLVRNLRWNRGWTQEELANKVGCGKRTIENVESEKPISVTTLRDVAEALGVTPEALRLHDRPPATEVSKDTVEVESKAPQDGPGDGEQPGDAGRDGKVAVDTGRKILDLVIEIDYDSFTEAQLDRLLRLVRGVLELRGDIRVLGKRRGSVVLTLELTPGDAERLYWAVKGGQLAELGIVEARKLEEPRAPVGVALAEMGPGTAASTATQAPSAQVETKPGAQASSVPAVRVNPGRGARTQDNQGYRHCWQFKLLVVRGQQRGTYLVFPHGEFIIGRGSDCHIRTPSEWVSRQHCSLHITRTAAQIRDLGSTNGTLLNGARVVGERKLCDRDQLQVGPLVFEVRFDKYLTGLITAPARPAIRAEAKAPETLAQIDVATASELPGVFPHLPASQHEGTCGPGQESCNESGPADIQNNEP
jgi:transcriptional regulator with XRE-family HTH domain